MSKRIPVDPPLVAASERVGGKAASLARMRAAGLPVPEFVILEHAQLESLSAEARSSLIDAQITAAFELRGSESLCVRSSARAEDGGGASFAGQFVSVVDVRDPEAARQAVQAVLDSASAESVTAYRRRMGLEGEGAVAMSVILQRFVEGDVSGVMFTGQRIEAAPGRCEAIVQGEADTCGYLFRDGAYVAEVGEDSCLSAVQLEALRSAGKSLEATFGGPQDVEFTFVGDELVLLQSRPVTVDLGAPAAAAEGEATFVFDNSNIVESYAGVTTPLTYSYARHAYGVAYRESCSLAGISRAEIDSMDSVFDRLLVYLNGHVYYNLGNWYRLLSLFPGFEKNVGRMEGMMGVRTAAKILEGRPKRSLWGEIGLRWRMFRNYHRAPKMVAAFRSEFEEVYALARATDMDALSLVEVKDRFEQLRDRLLHGWQAPLLTDFLAMVFFGILKELTARWQVGEGNEGVVLDLLADGDLASTKPTRELIALAIEADQSPGLRARILAREQALDLDALELEHPAFVGKLRAWIEQWGARTMQELKLEVPTLSEDPSFVFDMLRNYLESPPTDPEELSRAEGARRAAAEQQIEDSLPWRRRWFYRWVLRRARLHIGTRENLRLCRSRAMGLVRLAFLRMGRGLASAGVLDEPGDVFFLDISEVLGAVDGTTGTLDLAGVARARKAAHAKALAKDDPPVHMELRKGVCEVDLAGMSEVFEGDLAGTPCSPGQVRGKVRVISGPKDDLSLQGEILVTRRTDPGWVPLFPSASGLLVERGSQLSHSAIVARELGLPTIVNIPGLMEAVRDGDVVAMDGARGEIELIGAQGDDA